MVFNKYVCMMILKYIKLRNGEKIRVLSRKRSPNGSSFDHVGRRMNKNSQVGKIHRQVSAPETAPLCGVWDLCKID